MSTMTEADWGAVGLFGLGLVFVVFNRPIGRTFNKFNSGFLLRPERAAGQYKHTHSGDYPLLIIIGLLMAVGSATAIAFRVAG